MADKFMLIPRNIATTVAVAEVINCNEKTSRYGLVLNQAEARDLVETHTAALRSNGRIEFTGGVITKIILAFCDSPFLSQFNYAETLSDLVETFHYFKNETLDEVSDDELIDFMKGFFNKNCQGSLELLQNRELEVLARSIRYGYGACISMPEDAEELLDEED